MSSTVVRSVLVSKARQRPRVHAVRALVGRRSASTEVDHHHHHEEHHGHDEVYPKEGASCFLVCGARIVPVLITFSLPSSVPSLLYTLILVFVLGLSMIKLSVILHCTGLMEYLTVNLYAALHQVSVQPGAPPQCLPF